MLAGPTAQQPAQRLGALAPSYTNEAEHEAAFREHEARKDNTPPPRVEIQLATWLSPLMDHGYFLFADRKSPGSRYTKIDLIVVGPSGVWIIGTRDWKNFSVAASAMFHGRVDVTEEVLRIADAANAAEAELARLGLAPGEIRAALVISNQEGRLGDVGPVEVVGEIDVHKHLTARGRRLTPAQVQRVLPIVMKSFPPFYVSQSQRQLGAGPETVRPEMPYQAPAESPMMSDDEVTEVIRVEDPVAPIESWMTFLDPLQSSLARRSFNGPARIRGSAGTGKTVVALHRAAYLARVHPHSRILYATFVSTLPAVMTNLLTRLAPESAGQIDFIGVHELAERVLAKRGVNVKVDADRAAALLEQAWAELEPDALERLTERSSSTGFDYWKEEVESVIKGRGLTTLQQYTDCARPGRTIGLNADDRRAVWSLFTGYELLLSAEGIHDFNDQILLAERALRERPLRDYAAVIVDEAQDLTLSMVRMLYSLVDDRPDAFTLIGDSQQSTNPGGYVLSEADISLAGRGVVLDHNYRNTVEIQEFATTFIHDQDSPDMDDSASAQADPGHAHIHELAVNATGRRGAKPIFAICATRQEHDREMMAFIHEAIDNGTSVADIAILCDTDKQVESAYKLLDDAGLRSMSLLEYSGARIKAIKVGTVNRAKGVEFNIVVLPWLVKDLSSADKESTARQLRSRYVGVTRARDGLWVGAC